MKLKIDFTITTLILIINGSIGCKKLVEIPKPINTITTTEAYSNDATAISTVLGIYDYMSWNSNGETYANYSITGNMGMYADELNLFGGFTSFQINTLQSNDGDVSRLWNGLYFTIYMANAAIEGLQASPAVSVSVKKQLTGEAKFIRAFAHFYLVNLFGDVPLIISSDFATNSKLTRTPSTDVYKQIIQDLKDAKELLSDKYARADGGYYTNNAIRLRPNKAAATALLARAYLYTNNAWANAEIQATEVINNTAVYSLLTVLNNVFLASTASNTNAEAIWQLEVSNNWPYATREGNYFIPIDNTSTPSYFLIPELLSAFETGDNRKVAWIDSTTPSGGPAYYYPLKFKVREGSQGNVMEYYMPLRLAEQYLIRAEARAQLNKLVEAVADLNVIRARAGLPALSNSLNQGQVLDAVSQENRIEFFAEWGHRWFDLKRANQADNVIGSLKPATWLPTAKLLPIPLSELQTNPNLIQNPGYN